MSTIRIALFVLLLCNCVHADGYRLIHQTGIRQITVMPRVVTGSLPPNNLVDVPDVAAPTKIQKLLPWTIQLVTRIESLVREQPPRGSDKLATSEYYGRQREQAGQILDGLIGVPIRGRFDIVNFVERKPPTPPRYIGDTAPIALRAMYEGQKKQYEVLLEDFRNQRYMIVAQIPWQAPTVISPKARAEIAAATAGEAKTQARLKWEARKPHHFAYFFGGDEVADWKPGQKREVLGLIQSAGVFLYDGGETNDYSASFGKENIYAGLELFLKIVPEAAPASGLMPLVDIAPRDSRPVPDTDSAASKLLLMAHNYRQAKRYDLARNQYQKVVDQHPDTDAAREAVKWIQFVDEQMKLQQP